jgi:hypothetical protein
MKQRSSLLNYVLYLFVIMLTLILLSRCEKDKFDETALNDYLKNLPPISSEMPAEKAATVTSTDMDTTLEYIYITDYYEAAAGFDVQLVLNPQTDVIYPGALLKGESILDGTYTLIPATRKPITISTSLTGGIISSVVVEDPKLSSVREAVNTLMNQTYDVPYANMSFTVEQAYSEQQIALSLRASYTTGILNVEGGFDFSNTKIQTRLIAKFIQSYYTLDMDLPKQPSDLFEEDVDRALCGTMMPMYVSTVTFGRIALFTIESELSETEVRAYLDASYNGISGSVSSDFDALNAKSTMKVYILGGSGSAAGATINGFDEFKNYIQSGGNFSSTSPGAPISYKLRYIRDNSIGKIVFSASYPIVTAIPRTDNIVYDITTALYSLMPNVNDEESGDLRLYGYIVSYPKSLGSTVGFYHFSRTSDSPLAIPEQKIYYFPQGTSVQKLWQGMKQNDSIMVYIAMHEVDTWPYLDDHYEVETFPIPVKEIVAGALGSGTYDISGLTVKEETNNNNIDITFRLTPVMRRL